MVRLRGFLSRPPDGAKSSLSRLGHLAVGEGEPSTLLIGGMVRQSGRFEEKNELFYMLGTEQ
jgi:hypothetical protein